jgi:CheY-like chemotaxis protein
MESEMEHELGAQGQERMTDELFSLRVINVSESPHDQDLLRQAASTARVPIDFSEADGADGACRSLADTDLVFVDGALGDDAVGQIASAARALARPAFTVLLEENAGDTFATDAVAKKPARLDDAKRLIQRATYVRLPSRVLVVDDSQTMRTIVRKTLNATRFPFEVSEASEGISAIALARKTLFDIVFLDYNMPGLSGFETMAEFRREKRAFTFVLMTSVEDEAIADRALAEGAAFLKKPFFPADIEALLCKHYGLRALNPQRA